MKRTTTRIVVAVLISLGVTLPVGMAGAADNESDKTSDPAITTKHPAPPPIRFGCRLAHVGGEPVVGCRWTPIENRRVAGYVLYRAQVRPNKSPVRLWPGFATATAPSRSTVTSSAARSGSTQW